MEEFADRLSRLAELSDDELSSLEQELVSAFDAADGAGDIDTMQQIADALDEVRGELSNRETGEQATEEAAAEAEAEPVPAAAVTASSESDEPEETEPETEVEETEEPSEETETDEAEATAEAETTDDAVDAADQQNEEETVEVTSDDVPAENQPVAAAAPNFVITAGGDVPGFTAGQTLSDMDQAIEALTAKVNNLRGVSGEVRTVVASLKREFDEDKMLRKNDPQGNSQKVRDIVRAGREGGREALVAAGWCAPKTPIYDHVNGMAIGVTDTPVLDSFASLGVDRGGITWQPPFALGAIPADKFFGRWTNIAAPGALADFQFSLDGKAAAAAAAAGSGVTGGAGEKPCLDIPCPPEASAELGAVPLCLCTDVLMSRANPEFIRHFTDLVMVAQARYKEQWALAWMDAIAALNKSHGAPGGDPDQPLGACRDILLVWRAAAANFRWVNRLSPTQELRVYAPSWLRDAMAADLTVQMPGDDTLSVSYAVVEGYIADLHLSPVWYIDDNPAGAATDNFDSIQGFGAKALWYMDLPGVIVHMDGGSLDLGVQRTKEDIAKNRFCEFAETFDGLAYMGPTQDANGGWLIKGETTVVVRGGFAPAVAVTTSIIHE